MRIFSCICLLVKQISISQNQYKENIITYYNTLKCDPICVNHTCGTYSIELGDSSDSVTIVIVSVTITTVIVKKTIIMIVDMWFRACIFDTVLSQYIHNHVKKHAKMARNISDEINLDKELEDFLLEGSNSDVLSFSATSGNCSESVSKF